MRVVTKGSHSTGTCKIYLFPSRTFQNRRRRCLSSLRPSVKKNSFSSVSKTLFGQYSTLQVESGVRWLPCHPNYKDSLPSPSTIHFRGCDFANVADFNATDCSKRKQSSGLLWHHPAWGRRTTEEEHLMFKEPFKKVSTYFVRFDHKMMQNISFYLIVTFMIQYKCSQQHHWFNPERNWSSKKIKDSHQLTGWLVQ